MVYNSSRGFAVGPLLERSVFSLSPTPPADFTSTSSKRLYFRTLGSLASPFEFGSCFYSNQRFFASPAWCATKLHLADTPEVPINKCALSTILSPLVSQSVLRDSVHTSKCSATGTSSAAAAFPATPNKAALSFILSPSPMSLSEQEVFTRIPPRSTQRLLDHKPVRSTSYKSITRRSTRSYTIRGSPLPQQSYATTSGPECSSATRENPVKKGTRFCTVDGCMKLSKHNKRCWRHGGSIKYKVADCDNRAKSKGVCWSHGGGTVCAFENCDTSVRGTTARCITSRALLMGFSE